jgi:molybdopterin/thiamine biosynthesis adenylyltransferase
VVIVGVGSVGSQVAKELANVNVGHITLIDGKPLRAHHLGRHALTTEYVDFNKALGMERYFAKEVPTLRVNAVPRDIDQSITDDELDALLKDADLIVAATDGRGVQRRIGRRALSLDIPALFPGLYERNGGEVFVQPGPALPCFLCRDGFRPANEALRGVAATNPDILAIIQLTSQLSLAILDRSTDYRRLLRPERGEVPQLFVQNGLTLARLPVPWRRNCPSCAVGPAPSQSVANEARDELLSSLARRRSASVSQSIRLFGYLQRGVSPIPPVLQGLGIAKGTLAAVVLGIFAPFFACLAVAWLALELAVLLLTGHFAS